MPAVRYPGEHLAGSPRIAPYTTLPAAPPACLPTFLRPPSARNPLRCPGGILRTPALHVPAPGPPHGPPARRQQSRRPAEIRQPGPMAMRKGQSDFRGLMGDWSDTGLAHKDGRPLGSWPWCLRKVSQAPGQRHLLENTLLSSPYPFARIFRAGKVTPPQAPRTGPLNGILVFNTGKSPLPQAASITAGWL